MEFKPNISTTTTSALAMLKKNKEIAQVCPACSGYMMQKGVDGDWHCDGCEATRRSSEVIPF